MFNIQIEKSQQTDMDNYGVQYVYPSIILGILFEKTCQCTLVEGVPQKSDTFLHNFWS